MRLRHRSSACWHGRPCSPGTFSTCIMQAPSGMVCTLWQTEHSHVSILLDLSLLQGAGACHNAACSGCRPSALPCSMGRPMPAWAASWGLQEIMFEKGTSQGSNICIPFEDQRSPVSFGGQRGPVSTVGILKGQELTECPSAHLPFSPATPLHRPICLSSSAVRLPCKSLS